MEEQMTKARLLELLRDRRAEFDACIAEVPHDRLTEPGTTGHWSVKDVIAHLTYYERWMADRMHEQLRGESYTPTELDMMHWDQRNEIHYEKSKSLPLAQVQAESREAFERLIAAVAAHSEAFLTEPQQFEGAPGPVIVWEMLRSEVYDHYPQHISVIREWLASG